MKIHDDIMNHHLKKQVAEGQLERVIDELLDKVDKREINTLIVLKNRLRRLSKASSLGIVSWKERFDYETSIVVSVLDFIDSIS